MTDSGKRVLIVEDMALIGLDLASTLESYGYRPVGPFPSEDKALAALSEDPPDLAVLDINLGEDSHSGGVADRLTQLGVPFVFITGYTAGRAALLDRYNRAPRLTKPCSPGDLAAALDRLQQPAAGA